MFSSPRRSTESIHAILSTPAVQPSPPHSDQEIVLRCPQCVSAYLPGPPIATASCQRNLEPLLLHRQSPGCCFNALRGKILRNGTRATSRLECGLVSAISFATIHQPPGPRNCPRPICARYLVSDAFFNFEKWRNTNVQHKLAQMNAQFACQKVWTLLIRAPAWNWRWPRGRTGRRLFHTGNDTGIWSSCVRSWPVMGPPWDVGW